MIGALFNDYQYIARSTANGWESIYGIMRVVVTPNAVPTDQVIFARDVADQSRPKTSNHIRAPKDGGDKLDIDGR